MSKTKTALLVPVALLVCGAAIVWWIEWKPELSWLTVNDDWIARMDAVPDLSPQLSKEEVINARTEWARKFERTRRNIKPGEEPGIGNQRAWQLLAPELEGCTKVTIYSLYPHLAEQRGMAGLTELESGALRALLVFHGRPIFGSVTIDQVSDASKWSSFLQGHIEGGSQTHCFFMPRHGFRVTTQRGDVDLIMCFRCGKMGFDERTRRLLRRKTRGWKPDEEARYFPILSPFVRDAVNALFDKQGIKREVPASRVPIGDK